MQHDHQWKVGDKVVFKTGRCSKEEIELIPLDNERSGIQFHVKDGFEVKNEPYTYICEVLQVDKNHKMEMVKLVRKITAFPNGTSGIGDLSDDEPPIRLFMPYVFPWEADARGNKFNWETYVILSYNTDFTPLMGAACNWHYGERNLEDMDHNQQGFKMHDGDA